MTCFIGIQIIHYLDTAFDHTHPAGVDEIPCFTGGETDYVVSGNQPALDSECREHHSFIAGIESLFIR
ncbi:hypothetical protein D3C75_1173960 [compost metagenome]